MPIHFSTQENLFSLKVRFFKNLKLHSSKVILTTIILKESLANQNHLGGPLTTYKPGHCHCIKLRAYCKVIVLVGGGRSLTSIC